MNVKIVFYNFVIILVKVLNLELLWVIIFAHLDVLKILKIENVINV